MVLGEVVTMVVGSLKPVDFELSLGYSVLDPVESHVHCLGSLDFDALVGKSIGCGVVSGDSSGCSLFSSHFSKDIAHVCCFLAIVEEGSTFSFRGCCHDIFHDSAFNVDCTVGFEVVWGFIMVPQIEVSSNSRSGFGFTQVGGVTVDVQDHVRFVESNGSIRVGGCIVEELDDCVHGFGCAMGLGCCNSS